MSVVPALSSCLSNEILGAVGIMYHGREVTGSAATSTASQMKLNLTLALIKPVVRSRRREGVGVAIEKSASPVKAEISQK